MKILLGALLCAGLMTSCVSIQSAGVSGPLEKAGSSVRADASGIGFLSLTAPSADELERIAMTKLASQGATKNITSRLTVRNFVIVQLYSVEASAEK